MTTRHLWFALVSLLSILSLTGCNDGTAAMQWELRDVSPDGRVLTIDAFGGKCRGSVTVTKDETPETVYVYALQRTVACEDVGYRQQLTVHLRAPLGRRALVGCDPQHVNGDACTLR